jgi:hypothetical protein
MATSNRSQNDIQLVNLPSKEGAYSLGSLTPLLSETNGVIAVVAID